MTKDFFLDQTLVRFLWVHFLTRRQPWPDNPSFSKESYEASLLRTLPAMISNEVPLSSFPSTDPFPLPIGYKSPVVFAAFRIELSFILKSLSLIAVAWIKYVLPFLKCLGENFSLTQTISKSQYLKNKYSIHFHATVLCGLAMDLPIAFRDPDWCHIILKHVSTVLISGGRAVLKHTDSERLLPRYDLCYCSRCIGQNVTGHS